MPVTAAPTVRWTDRRLILPASLIAFIIVTVQAIVGGWLATRGVVSFGIADRGHAHHRAATGNDDD